MNIPYRRGNEVLIGAHNTNDCEESDGCYRVTIEEVWTHEDHRELVDDQDIGSTADIAVIRSAEILLIRMNTIFLLTKKEIGYKGQPNECYLTLHNKIHINVNSDLNLQYLTAIRFPRRVSLSLKKRRNWNQGCSVMQQVHTFLLL